MNTFTTATPHEKQTQRRMTKVSRANLEAADHVQILFCDSGGFMVKVGVQGRVAFVCGSDGFVLVYPQAGAAERAIRRIRPDITPSLYVHAQGAEWTMGGTRIGEGA